MKWNEINNRIVRLKIKMNVIERRNEEHFILQHKNQKVLHKEQPVENKYIRHWVLLI